MSNENSDDKKNVSSENTPTENSDEYKDMFIKIHENAIKAEATKYTIKEMGKYFAKHGTLDGFSLIEDMNQN